MKTISKLLDRIMDWCWHHVEFTKSLIMVWHIAITALFWTIFDHKVGIPIFFFAWTMLVLGLLWYALPTKVAEQSGDTAKEMTSIPTEDFEKMEAKAMFLEWVFFNYELKDRVATGFGSVVPWDQAESIFWRDVRSIKTSGTSGEVQNISILH